jgi:hypothetical protein
MLQAKEVKEKTQSPTYNKPKFDRGWNKNTFSGFQNTVMVEAEMKINKFSELKFVFRMNL